MFSLNEEMKCFLCSNKAEKLPHQGLEYHLYCKNCGEYKITIQAELVLKNMHEDIKYILSSQTFEKYYYEHKPLTILAEDIQKTKDIPLLEKLFKLSKYLYHETKYAGLGSKIGSISNSQFYCRNTDEYLQLLETLKSMNIIEFEKIGGNGDNRVMIYPPKLLGKAVLAFEEGINNSEHFRKVFMTTNNNGNNINLNLQGDGNQLSFATNNANITATQYNSLDIKELKILLENVFKSLPQDICNEKRDDVKESLAAIHSEVQSQNPRKIIIKNTISALKGIATTAGFLAAIAKLAEFFQIII